MTTLEQAITTAEEKKSVVECDNYESVEEKPVVVVKGIRKRKRPLTDYVDGIKSCFIIKGSVYDVRIEDNKIYISIEDGENWWENKCVLQDWFFDYEKFKTLNMDGDCASYGLFAFWKRE